MQKNTSDTQVATKKDIRGLRIDFKKTDKSLRAEILKVDERVENIKESQKRVEKKLDKIAITLDGFVGRVDNLTADNQVGIHHTRELRLQVDDQEKRIKNLESPAQTA